MKKYFIGLILFTVFSVTLASQIDKNGYIPAGKDRIFYEAKGKGPVMIFIHDGLVNSEIWIHQFAFFSKRYRVIRYDRRGYGKSSISTGDYSNIEDLKSLFIHLGIKKAMLIAMSSGGRLAIDFTLQYPEKISALVLVGAVVNGFPFTRHFYSRGGHLPSGPLSFQQRREYYAKDDPYEIFSENVSTKQHILELLKKYPQKRHIPQKKKTPKQPAIHRLSEIKIPALILVGEFDMPDVHAHAGAINAGIAGSERDVIPKAGHLIPMEQPDLFNDRLLRFLKGLSDSDT